jgi:hypothetical protein
MSKRSKISWNDNQNKQLAKAVKNFNAKLKYIIDTKPWLTEYIPEKLSVKKLKTKIATRQDLNREINSIKRFSEKGAEEIKVTDGGLTFSKWHIKEVKNLHRIANIKKAIERKNLNIDVTQGNMGQIENQNLRPKIYNENKTAKEWEKMVESLENQVKATFKDELLDRYKENYLKAVDEHLGSQGEEIRKLIENIDPKEFYEYSVNNPLLSIDFIYEPQELLTRIKYIKKEWSIANDYKMNMEEDE